jgi:bile acid:Na+ symporter, BASS family
MPIDKLVNLLASITLLEMMVTIGLGVMLSQISGVLRDWQLIMRAAVANYLLVPAAAVALLALFHVPPLVATGFLIAAVCPGAPYGPPLTSAAKGNVVASIGLMVVLAASSAVFAPLLLQLLLPIVTGDHSLQVNTLGMVTTLMFSQLLPLCAGLFIRHRYPAFAQKLKIPAARISSILNLLLIGTILFAQWRMLINIRLLGYVGMLLLLAATFVAGLAIARRNAAERKTMAITTSVRNVGVAVVIATGSFAGTPAIPATIAYALVQTLAVAIIAILWGRFTAADATLPLNSAAASAPVAPH